MGFQYSVVSNNNNNKKNREPGLVYVTERVSFLSSVLSDRPPVHWWSSLGEEWDAVTCDWDNR